MTCAAVSLSAVIYVQNIGSSQIEKEEEISILFMDIVQIKYHKLEKGNTLIHFFLFRLSIKKSLLTRNYKIWHLDLPVDILLFDKY